MASHEKSPSFRFFIFPECVARFPFHFGGLGVRLCSPKVAFVSATVRKRPQPFATVRNRPTVRDRLREGRGAVNKLAFAKEVSL